MSSEIKPFPLSKKEKEEIIQKALAHPRLKQFVHVTHPDGLYELFKRWIIPGPIIAAIRMFMVAFLFWFHYFVQWLIYLGYKDLPVLGSLRWQTGWISEEIISYCDPSFSQRDDVFCCFSLDRVC